MAVKEAAKTGLTVKARIREQATGIDACEFVVHYLVKQALLAFKQYHRVNPRLLYMPRSVEAAIVVDLARSQDIHVSSLRQKGFAQDLFGCPVIWDADEFKLAL